MQYDKHTRTTVVVFITELKKISLNNRKLLEKKKGKIVEWTCLIESDGKSFDEYEWEVVSLDNFWREKKKTSVNNTKSFCSGRSGHGDQPE